MRPFLTAVMLLLAAPFALAAPVTIEYQLPTETCEGQPIAAGEIEAMEIYVSAGPIPASDVACPDPGQPVDPVPQSYSTMIEATDQSGSVTVDLIGGQTYHVRARVRTAAGGWSNLSNEMTKAVPAAPVSAPVLIRIGL